MEYNEVTKELERLKTCIGMENSMEALNVAINSLKKQEKINNVLISNCLSGLDGKCCHGGECMLHRYLEIIRIVRSEEE